jgi:putative colanic acid biosynthesis glycosyltransferase
MEKVNKNNKSKIKVSIVTVVYRDLPGLIRTFESIFEQRSQDYNWVVVDGGSNDGTVEFLEGLNAPFVTWVSENDRGIYDAMNKGALMSSGDYIVFMNAGDTFGDANCLRNVVNFLEQDKKNNKVMADILFGGAMLRFPGNGAELIYRPPRLAGSLWHGLPANHQATYYLRDSIIKIPYDLKYSLCGDYYIAAKLISSGARSIYLNKSLAIFEVGGRSYTNRWRLFLEPLLIQRDVLKLPLIYLFASAIRRSISTFAFILLSHKLFSKFVPLSKYMRSSGSGEKNMIK